MKTNYLLLIGTSMVLLAGCSPTENNSSDRGMSSVTNSMRDTLSTNMPSGEIHTPPALTTNIPPASGTTN